MKQQVLREVPAQRFDEQYAALRQEMLDRLDQVCKRGHYILAEEVKSFENDFARWLSAGETVGVASGSDAILLSLMALGVGAGDEVITTPFTYYATANAIVRTGAKPVFVDIDPASYNLDAAKIEKKITERTKVILPVHLYGQPCRMEVILELALKHKLFVVEDCAQAHGTRYRERTVGTFGEFGCFSFYPTKNLGAYGDAGAVATSNAALAQEIRLLRNQGSIQRYHHEKVGLNSRLDELQAAILNVKLKHLDSWIRTRREKAHRYNQLFKEYGITEAATPFEEPDGYHTFHLYVIRVSRCQDLLQYLNQMKIQCYVYYPFPLHLEKAFAFLGCREGDYPEAEKASRETLALPLYPELSDEDQDYVAGKVADFYRSKV